MISKAYIPHVCMNLCFHLYVKYSPVNGVGLQQGHRASAEASTCHSAAKYPLHLHGCSHQLIQLPAAHLVQVSNTGTSGGLPHSVMNTGYKHEYDTGAAVMVPQGVMALHHELAELFVGTFLQGFSSSNSPLYFLDHMTSSLVGYIIQSAPGL